MIIISNKYRVRKLLNVKGVAFEIYINKISSVYKIHHTVSMLYTDFMWLKINEP